MIIVVTVTAKKSVKLTTQAALDIYHFTQTDRHLKCRLWPGRNHTLMLSAYPGALSL